MMGVDAFQLVGHSRGVGVAAGIGPMTVHRPREFFGGACVGERTSVLSGGPCRSCPCQGHMPLQRACGVLLLARRFCGGEWPYSPSWERAANTAETRGATTSGRQSVRCPGGEQSRGAGLWGTSDSAIAGTGRPVTTTKPSLRPVARRHTSHALASGHRRKDRPRHPCVRAEPAVGDTSRASGSHDNGAGIAWQRRTSPPRALGAGVGRSTPSLERRMCNHPQSPPFTLSRKSRCSD